MEGRTGPLRERQDQSQRKKRGIKIPNLPLLWPRTQKNLPVVDGGVGEDGHVGGELAPEPERR